MISPVKLWRNQKSTRAMLGKTGIIVSWTLVRVPLSGYSDQAPYPVVIIELVGGQRMTAQLVDYESQDLTIGREVRTVLRRIAEPDNDGVIFYGIKATPTTDRPKMKG